MPKVVVVSEHKPRAVPMQDLPVGELGIIEESINDGYNGLFVLRTYQGVVSLLDPAMTWDMQSTITVRHIPNATVTLTFGNHALSPAGA